MSTQTEALKLALEALENLIPIGERTATLQTKAITAIKEALAHPEQEPVENNASAWFALVMNAAAELEDASNCLRDEDAKRVALRGAKYYRDEANALYTTPPQRKPLTDEQLDKAGMKLAECMDYPWEHMPEEGKRNMRDHAKAIIEAAHDIKGGV